MTWHMRCDMGSPNKLPWFLVTPWSHMVKKVRSTRKLRLLILKSI